VKVVSCNSRSEQIESRECKRLVEWKSRYVALGDSARWLQAALPSDGEVKVTGFPRRQEPQQQATVLHVRYISNFWKETENGSILQEEG
jgi:primosomal replication protein N